MSTHNDVDISMYVKLNILEAAIHWMQTKEVPKFPIEQINLLFWTHGTTHI